MKPEMIRKYEICSNLIPAKPELRSTQEDSRFALYFSRSYDLRVQNRKQRQKNKQKRSTEEASKLHNENLSSKQQTNKERKKKKIK